MGLEKGKVCISREDKHGLINLGLETTCNVMFLSSALSNAKPTAFPSPPVLPPASKQG